MPATLTKPATPTLTPPKPTVLTLVAPRALVDEFADLSARREDFAPIERRYQKCRAELAAMVADADPEAMFTAAGERWEVLISACAFEKKPDMPAVKKKLGAQAFLECVTCSIKALGAWLTAPEVEDLLVTTQTGPRKFVPAPLRDL
jgi:hypothetical protein